MSYREQLPAALLALALGCGGKTQSGAKTAMGSSGSATSSTSNRGSSSSGWANDAGVSGTFDAEIPDAFPASCGGQFTLVLDPDAATNTCAFSPADVACGADADCTAYLVVGCGCIDPVWGVNKANTVRCPAPPCPPPSATCPSDASGFRAQDCQLVATQQDLSVACVNHQCMTFVPGAR